MKKIGLFSCAVFLGILLSFGTAWSEMLSGMVVDVGTDSITIEIGGTEAAPESYEERAISISTDTKLNGLTSLEDLYIGDEVNVDAEKDAQSGAWKALSLELVGLEELDEGYFEDELGVPDLAGEEQYEADTALPQKVS